MHPSFIIILLLPLSTLGQTITGKIYDEDSKVKGAYIINIKNRDTTYTDTKGSFKIYAQLNDTIIISSSFHYEKQVKITKNHIENINVFELKKQVNVLNEVLLEEVNKNKLVNYGNISNGIMIDIKNNPHLYMPKSSYSSGINFIELAKLIGLNKLFKKKKHPEKQISYNQIDSLFANSNLFNDVLLTKNLKIEKQYKYWFYEYCETKNLNTNLLLEKNNIILLDSFYTYSTHFLKHINTKNKLKN